ADLKCSKSSLEPAEAGSSYRHIGAGKRDVEPRLDEGRFGGLGALHQAFVEAMQAPYIVGMLAGAAQRVVEAEIGAIDRFRLFDLALFEQKRARRMAGRLHPAPGLVIGQGVVELDGRAQMRKGLSVAAL